MARTADLVIMMVDVTKGEVQKELLTAELESVGIRLNKMKPGIYFKVLFTCVLVFTQTRFWTVCNIIFKASTVYYESLL